jgi:hypothetical protein
MRLTILILAASLCGVMGTSTPCFAQDVQDAQDAEVAAKVRQIRDEMNRFAGKNAWNGVDRKYQQVIALTPNVSLELHRLGAQAARMLGKTYEMYTRLENITQLESDTTVQQEISALESSYGRVRILGNIRWTVVLSRPSMPFLPDQKSSVKYAIDELANTGSFEGMIPVGKYLIGEREVVVEAGKEWQEVQVNKSDVSQVQGLILYSGPVMFSGYSFLGSPVSDEIVGADNKNVPAPDTFLGSGVALELGVELGLSPRLGVVGTIGYRGMYGTDTFHALIGSFGGTYRVNAVRLSVAPNYGVIRGQGVGVANWFDISQDPSIYPTDSLSYEGRAMVGGASASLGYTLLPVTDSLDGILEVGGSWLTDSTRGYYTFGLRFGMIPSIPKYKGA